MCHVRDILRRRPPIGIAPTKPLANVAAAEVEDDEVPLAAVALVVGAGGFVSMTSWIFRIQVEAMEALPATQQWVFVGCIRKRTREHVILWRYGPHTEAPQNRW